MAGSLNGLHAQVSDEALEGWGNFARHHGVTRTAVVEAIGQLMTSDTGNGAPPPPDIVDQVVALARRVDFQRRVRGKNR